MSTNPATAQSDAGPPSPTVPQSPDATATATAKQSDVPVRNLVVCQLPRSIDTAVLRAIFSEFGELVTALVMMDVNSGKSRGFGFVWFEKSDDAMKAMETMNGRELEEGKKLKVFPSEHPEGLSEAAAIAVLNFPGTVAHTSGRRLFAKYGKVVKYEPDRVDGRASGSGGGLVTTTITVEYETILEARAAVNALHGVRALQFDEVNVNLNLPLVTKYLIDGAHRPASRASSHRTTPAHSGSTNPQMRMGGSGSANRPAMFTGNAHHPHVMAAAAYHSVPHHHHHGHHHHHHHAQPQFTATPVMQPAAMNMSGSGSSSAPQFMYVPVPQPQPQFHHQALPVQQQQQPQQSNPGAASSVFQLPSATSSFSTGAMPSSASPFMPAVSQTQPQQQQQQQQPSQGQPQTIVLPAGYVLVQTSQGLMAQPASAVQAAGQQQPGQQQQQQQPSFVAAPSAPQAPPPSSNGGGFFAVPQQ